MSEKEAVVSQSQTEEQNTVETAQPTIPSYKAFSLEEFLEQQEEGNLPVPLESDDDFVKAIEQTLSSVQPGEIVKGVIVGFDDDNVLVDVGLKSAGIVPRIEFPADAELKVGDEVEVYVEKLEDGEGKPVLSRRRAEFLKVWRKINEAYENKQVLRAKILRRIKGGFVVDLMGVEAFLPGSQVDIRPVRDFDAWIGREIDVQVVKINHATENVVVSRKVLLEDQLKEQREALLSKLERGMILEGYVKAITDFGIFVDLGGVDGLVHITDISWGRVNHPSEFVKLDEKIKVVVLDFDEEKKRISLGMKQLTPHPWENIGDKYQPGVKVKGKVVSLTDYGAFVEIEKGIEGLIHVSEMSWTEHIKHPSQVVSLGQTVEAVVLNIDKENRKLSLGLKQLQPDPWKELVKKYPVGSRHKGIVRNIANFGVFVELEPGVDGLIHISDLSWTKKIRHPAEVVKRGQEIEVVVLSVDLEQRRISLGHKQLQENPWDELAEKYKVGTETEGRIVRILDKGVIVELPDGVDGFVPASQLSFAPIDNIGNYFRVDEIIPLEVIEFDKDARKIVLSAVEYLKDKDEEVINTYNANHPVPGADEFVEQLRYQQLKEQGLLDQEAPAPTLADHLEEVPTVEVTAEVVETPAQEPEAATPEEPSSTEAPAEASTEENPPADSGDGAESKEA